MSPCMVTLGRSCGEGLTRRVVPRNAHRVVTPPPVMPYGASQLISGSPEYLRIGVPVVIQVRLSGEESSVQRVFGPFRGRALPPMLVQWHATT